MNKNKPSKSILPAVVLMIFAPLITEVLPGATRFSSIFVFPIEMCVWGGGALLIRYIVRKRQLGWLSMLLLALALSMAEEFLIQQTSLAPMVIQVKGVTYARAMGLNYVYLLWALIYEPVFVVLLPVSLVEMIFPGRRKDLWLSKGGVATVIMLFLAGCFLAWYSWTQIARPAVFHVPAYHPPFIMVCLAVVCIGFLLFTGAGLPGSKRGQRTKPLNPPQPWMTAIAGAVWAVLLYGIVALAFGPLPFFPPLAAVGIGLLLAAAAVYLVPRWTAGSFWQTRHRFSLILGILTGSMAVSFTGFIGAAPADLYFKIVVDIIALVLLIMLGSRVKKRVMSPDAGVRL